MVDVWYVYVWLVFSVIGFALALLLLNEALKDYRAIVDSGRNGGLKFIAASSIKLEVITCAYMLTAFFTGIIVLVDVLQWLLVPLLVSLLVLITLKSIIRYRSRRALLYHIVSTTDY